MISRMESLVNLTTVLVLTKLDCPLRSTDNSIFLANKVMPIKLARSSVTTYSTGVFCHCCSISEMVLYVKSARPVGFEPTINGLEPFVIATSLRTRELQGATRGDRRRMILTGITTLEHSDESYSPSKLFARWCSHTHGLLFPHSYGSGRIRTFVTLRPASFRG